MPRRRVDGKFEGQQPEQYTKKYRTPEDNLIKEK